ncbi:hypothetical protein PN44_15595, partial [Vibrio anguillarum]
ASRPPHRLAEAHITFYQKYVKHFLGKSDKNQINRWLFNQSAVKLNFSVISVTSKHKKGQQNLLAFLVIISSC